MRDFTFFWSGPFSQWYPCKFEIAGTYFNCAEQFMMYSKALLFHDLSSADAILKSKKPRTQKSLGRKISGFDNYRWQIFREGIVFSANYAKFTQNNDLKSLLLSTKGTQLVEASPKDRIWGIGLAEDDPKALNPEEWRGLNLLGHCLTRVRAAIELEIYEN